MQGIIGQSITENCSLGTGVCLSEENDYQFASVHATTDVSMTLIHMKYIQDRPVILDRLRDIEIPKSDPRCPQ